MTRWWNFVGNCEKLGFGSYIEFVYLNRGRYDYTAKDVGSVPETGTGM